MADAPWRCSECGTVNEPVANACRTCGRWPSMFDLEQSTLDHPESDVATATEPALEDFGPETYKELPAEVAEPGAPAEPAAPTEPEPQTVSRRRLIRRFVIPLAVVVYLLARAFLNN